MSRTLTSRNTAVPDWLLGARRGPAEYPTRAISTAGTVSAPDLEGGPRSEPSKDTSSPETAHHTYAQDADALVIPQSEANQIVTQPLGEAAMLEDPEQHPSSEASLRRRYAPVEDVSTTPPSGMAAHVSAVCVSSIGSIGRSTVAAR